MISIGEMGFSSGEMGILSLEKEKCAITTTARNACTVLVAICSLYGDSLPSRLPALDAMLRVPESPCTQVCEMFA